MRYVFFDIECANGGAGTICSFGYVITDENYLEIESRDIVINPPGKFKLIGRVGRPDVKLAYPESVFRSAPKFDHFYKLIKELLEGKEQIVIGHSGMNDAGFLRKSCERYGLPYIQFDFFDTQILYGLFMKEKKQIGLDNALANLGLDPSAFSHKSVEDARSTKRLLQHFVKMMGKNLPQIMGNYPEANCSSLSTCKRRIYGNGSDGECRSEYVEGYGKIRVLGEGKENWMLKGTKNHLDFIRFLDAVKPEHHVSQVLQNRTVSISLNFEAYHFEEMKKIVQKIVDAGGTYLKKASLSNLFVSYEALGEDGAPRYCSKTKYVMQAIEEGADIEIITFDELLEVLNLSEDTLLLEEE